MGRVEKPAAKSKKGSGEKVVGMEDVPSKRVRDEIAELTEAMGGRVPINLAIIR